ncbi:MAG: PDZ domain-containing protein [Planctomycetota bacterium]
MTYKLIRLVFVLIGVAALGGFGYSFYDFVRHSDQYTTHLDVVKLESGFQTTGSITADGILKNYADYKKVCAELNVTGKIVVAETEGGAQAVEKSKPRIGPEQVEVCYIQFQPESEDSSYAYIRPREKGPSRTKTPGDQPLGDLYRPNETFHLPQFPDLDITLVAIRKREVDLKVEGMDDLLTLEPGTFDVETSEIKAQGLLGGGPGAVSAPQTRQVAPNTWQLGSQDLEQIQKMPEDEIYAALQVQPVRDPATKKIRGLQVQRIQKDSVFTRQGLQQRDVILSVNGHPATDRLDLLKWLQSQEGAREFRVEVERLGGMRTLTYRLPGR